MGAQSFYEKEHAVMHCQSSANLEIYTHGNKLHIRINNEICFCLNQDDASEFSTKLYEGMFYLNWTRDDKTPSECIVEE